jgi:hypothetical protein
MEKYLGPGESVWERLSGAQQKGLIRDLLWVIALVSRLCRKSSEYSQKKCEIFHKPKPIEAVIIGILKRPSPKWARPRTYWREDVLYVREAMKDPTPGVEMIG